MGRRIGAALAAAAFVAAAASHAGAAEGALPRTVIAFYDGKLTPEWRDTEMHLMAEMPLNHLGLIVEPHDINDPLPDLSERDDVRGILTWWQSETLADPEAFLDWMREATQSGKRIAMLGIMAFLTDNDRNQTPEYAVNHLLGALGVRLIEHGYDVSHTAYAVHKVPEMVEYERELPRGLALAGAVRSIDPENTVYLRVRWPASLEPADLVITGPRGGIVAEDFSHYQVGESGFRQWYVDPFRFFREAFATDDLPKPDVTTQVGRRIYFSHVDGDGWRNQTDVQPYRRRRQRAIDVLIDRVLIAYPDLPVTLAPIAGDLDPTWCGDAPARDAARRAFALQNVEAASHTYSHPFFWSDFADGQPGGERIGDPQCQGAKGVIAARASRAYPKTAFDLDLELSGSVDYIETFLPPGKDAGLIQWSGNTMPFPEALRRMEENGLLNVNGGDTRFDSAFPSVSYVAPVGRYVDGYHQIYAAASNENTYTRLWTSAFYGFKSLQETLANTETPRRLAPVNVYYHVYSAERLASLEALTSILDHVRTLEVTPVATSDYARIANGFYTTRLVATGARQWRIENRDALQTIRFDLEDAEPDPGRCEGVLGWRRERDRLYVSLDPVYEEPVITLRRESVVRKTTTRPVLVESRWPVSDLQLGAAGFSFAAGGYGDGEMVWRVAAPGAYEVMVLGNERAATQSVTRAEDGTIAFTLPAGSPAPVRVHVAPAGDRES